jgi:hypothetical protein
MNKLDQIVAEYRQKLADAGAAFLLVYSTKNVITDTYDTRITSNSSQIGIRAILASIMRPTPRAIELLARELEAGARASLGMESAVIDKAVSEGAFSNAAKVLFEQLRPHFTIAGWEQPKAAQS